MYFYFVGMNTISRSVNGSNGNNNNNSSSSGNSSRGNSGGAGRIVVPIPVHVNRFAVRSQHQQMEKSLVQHLYANNNHHHHHNSNNNNNRVASMF